MERRAERDDQGFTLIELLVVIGIIAVISVVVVLVLNPAELLRQSRDSSRLSDMATLAQALNLYNTDIGGSMGSSSVTFVSLSDNSSTCTNIGLPALSSGWSYGCSSSTKKVDGTGWVPLNFGKLSSGSPLGSLPTDPSNASSSNLNYTYTTNGSQYEITSILESQKYKSQFATKPPVATYPEVIAAGSSLSLSAIFNPSGLVGYWNLDEGTGSTTIDQSGNGNTGTWNGTPSGSNGYYNGGKVGSYSGAWNGASSTYVNVGSNANLNITGNVSMAAWVKTNSTTFQMIVGGLNSTTSFQGYGLGIGLTSRPGAGSYWSGATTTWAQANTAVNDGTWHFVGVSVSGTTASFYTDGIPDGSVSSAQPNSFGGPRYLGDVGNYLPNTGVNVAFSGSLDDIRVYNRALSAAEMLAIYNAEK